MHTVYSVLIFGASYGSLLASKLLLAGHTVKLVCLPAEADLINREGTRVRIPVKGRKGFTEVESRTLPGALSADTPGAIDPGEYDLVALAMQEPQYGSPGLRELMRRVAEAKVPCISIMNMPPVPYLARIPGVSAVGCRGCYTDPAVWDRFDPALMTLCSPDPQAFRPPGEGDNVLQVNLPTNFKSARFDSDAHTAMLRRLEVDIEGSQFQAGDDRLKLPVKLKVYDSVFVPLAKWSMLVAGNYRCVQENGMRSIKDAVHTDIEATRAVYNWVGELCRTLGAAEADLVPFAKYAEAANTLTSPSSAARALSDGSRYIERIDCLVRTIAAQKGMQSDAVDDIVGLVDSRLEDNRNAGA